METLYSIWRSALQERLICGSVTEWAERYRWLSPNASARPGQWDTTLTPYLKAIMNACGVDHPCRKIVFQKSNQIGGTEALLNAIGYRIHQWPAPIMVVVPRNEDVAEYTETRIDPMIRHSPALAQLVGTDEGEGEGADNIAVKRFPGGQLFVRGARSKATYRSDPICVAILDDLDAFPVHAEGSHAELAEKRTNTYSERARKLILVSTPGEDGASAIATEYQASSQNLYHVPCPTCGTYQVLWRRSFKWLDDNPQTAHFVCEHCTSPIYEHHKEEMLAAGMWRPERPELSGIVEGYWIWAAYAPSSFRRWADMAQSWMDARAALKLRNDAEKMRTVVNLDWAQPFVPPASMALSQAEETIFERREPPFDNELQLIAKTSGVDIQGDRLEVSIFGWGVGDEGWMIEHLVIRGIIEEAGVWDELEHVLKDRGVASACVDASAYTDLVKDEVTKRAVSLFRAGCPIWVVKGRQGHGSLWPRMVLPGNIQNGRVETVTIAVDAGKDWLYGSLFRVVTPGPGYIHFCTNRDRSYFRQLLAEEEIPLTERRSSGAKYRRVPGRYRNEALDCAVYARAALLARAEIDPAIRQGVLGLGGQGDSSAAGHAHSAGSAGSDRPPRPASGKKPRRLTRGVL